MRKESWKNSKKKLSGMKPRLETPMSNLNKFLQKLWKVTLASDLHKKDKAEILRLLIFAFTIIVITALLVLNSP